MKPVLMRHVEVVNESFKAWRNARPYMHNPWHYHPEYEITFINRGRGTLLIGDAMLDYDNNSLVLIGPNIPHEWRSSMTEQPDMSSHSMALHFRMNIFGNVFCNISEMATINDFLEQSLRGITVKDPDVIRTVKQKLNQLLQTTGIERIGLLLSILNTMSNAKQLYYISSNNFVSSVYEDHDNRISLVQKYAMTNFRKQLSVEQMAAEVFMTPTSFCRFFKKRTNKSFIQYVNEIRIAYACKLLYEENLLISNIATECGFDSLSHFNKQFRKIKSVSPRQFVQQTVRPALQPNRND